LPANTTVNVSYVMNTGVLRVLPRLKTSGIVTVSTSTQVFGLEGKLRGQRVAVANQAGEILNLPAGAYRIETRFVPGNVQAVTDVQIKPGKHTAVDVDHVGGVVSLALQQSSSVSKWRVEDSNGTAIAEETAEKLQIALKPGRYTATASSDRGAFSITFDVETGKSKELLLD
jgi:hypothetical protein